MPIDDNDIRALLDHGTPVPFEKFDTLVAFARRVLDSAGSLDIPVVRGTADQMTNVGAVIGCDMGYVIGSDGAPDMIGLRRRGSSEGKA